jgi:hypothetical protein
VFVSGWREKYPFEVERAWISGWDLTVVFDDTLVGGLDEELDALGENLAASEGVTAVLHEDREVLHPRVDDLDVSEVEGKVHEAIQQTGIDGQAERRAWRSGSGRVGGPLSPTVLC